MEAQKVQILVEGCRQNDRVAQRQIYDAYKNAMYSVCLRICGNNDDAKDALQEGFIEAFKCIDAFRGESTFGAWIKTIMARKALRKLRKLNFEPESKATEEVVVFEDDLSGEELHNALSLLDEGYRSVFVLYEVEGYTHKEIAQMLGISEGTSKSQLHYAKKKLQLILQKTYGYERK